MRFARNATAVSDAKRAANQFSGDAKMAFGAGFAQPRFCQAFFSEAWKSVPANRSHAVDKPVRANTITANFGTKN